MIITNHLNFTSLGAIGEKHELLSFRDQKVKGQCHGVMKCSQWKTFWEFWRPCIQTSA